jgi:hypothetical protein
MKLHQAITSEAPILTLEGQGPVSYALTLDEVIRAGKVTNPYQNFVMAKLSEFFKNGLKSLALQSEVPLDFESKATSSVVVAAMKAMKPEDSVALAQYLKDCIAAGECALHDKKLDLVEWQKYVLSKQR